MFVPSMVEWDRVLCLLQMSREYSLDLLSAVFTEWQQPSWDPSHFGKGPSLPCHLTSKGIQKLLLTVSVSKLPPPNIGGSRGSFPH